MRRLAKNLAQRAMALATPLWLRTRKTSLLVLMYHRVLPVGHADRETEQAGMYVSPETLRMHIATLRRYFSLVHLDDWIRRRAEGAELPGLACALTFDDGWLDNYEFAFPILRASAAPATIYLVSDLVGTRYTFWPNRLAQLLKGTTSARDFAGLPQEFTTILGTVGYTSGSMNARQIDTVIARCKQAFTDAEIEVMLADVQARIPSAGDSRRDLMNWDEIREMQATGLVRFGSHSRRHTRLLDVLAGKSVQDEVLESAAVIEKALGVRPSTFCYPNGDHSAAALALVREHYAAATTTVRGWNSPDSDLHLLKRVGLHEDVSATPAAFLSRLVGIG
jgi:peptidoglycan/xylan/chitin deacetylase (PgdA/CDA1 family)